MALSETLAVGSNQSGEFTPTNGVSDVIVEGSGRGQIFLKAKAPGSSKWQMVADQTGAFCVNTPDMGVVYSFFGVTLEEAVQVYIGP